MSWLFACDYDIVSDEDREIIWEVTADKNRGLVGSHAPDIRKSVASFWDC